MIDLYLKADTEQDLINALSFARATDELGEEVWKSYTHDYSLDLIGTIYNDDTVVNEEGDVVTPATPKPGYHANIRCKEWVALLVPDSVKINPPPSKIKRTWA